MPNLADVPDGIVTRIAFHLQLIDVVSFSRASKQTYRSCLPALWHSVDLSLVGADLRKPRNERTFARCSAVMHSISKVVPVERRGTVGLGLLSRQFELLGVHKYIRVLTFDISTHIPGQLAKVLEMVANTLVQLDLTGKEWTNEIPFGHHTPERIFSQMSYTFCRLRSLDLTINQQWEARIREIVGRTPNLRTLRLLPVSPYLGGWGESFAYAPVKTKDAWPTLDLLETLEIQHMSTILVPFVLHVINTSPNLKRVILRDPANEWFPPPNDPLLVALSSSSKLEYLGVKWRVMWAFEVGDGFENLQMLSLDEAPGHCSVRLATFPALRRLFLYPSKWEREPYWYWRCTGEVAMRPHAIEPIPKLITAALETCPHLELVQQLYNEEHEFADDDWTSIHRACDESHYSFILIGQYTFDAAASKGSFYHLRHFSARAEMEYRRQIFHAHDVWTEYIDYQGKCPPADVLGRVYSAMENRTSWSRPDRQKTLSAAGLQVLDGWVQEEASRREDPYWID